MIWLNERDTIKAGAEDMGECVKVMEGVFKDLANGKTRMTGATGCDHGATIHLPDAGPDDRYACMAGTFLKKEGGATGMKWYGSMGGNRDVGLPRSNHIICLNDKFGVPKALMCGNTISAMRTGAVAGVAVKHLGKRKGITVGMIGAGRIAERAVKGIESVAEIEMLKVKATSMRSSEAFLKRVKGAWISCAVDDAEGVELAVRGSDIIVVAVDGKEPLETLREKWVKDGNVVIIMLSAGKVERKIMQRGMVVFDNMFMQMKWREEQRGLEDGCRRFEWAGFEALKDDRLTTSQLGLILTNRIAKRSVRHPCVVAAGGMVLEDIAWAEHVYQTARENNIGTRLQFF